MRSWTNGAILGFALVLSLGPGAGHAGNLADPTRPPQTRAAPAQPAPARPLTLDFVVRSRDRHLARINGAWVSEGETIAGARVERIEADHVVVRRGGQSRTLRVGSEGIEKKMTEQ